MVFSILGMQNNEHVLSINDASNHNEHISTQEIVTIDPYKENNQEIYFDEDENDPCNQNNAPVACIKCCAACCLFTAAGILLGIHCS